MWWALGAIIRQSDDGGTGKGWVNAVIIGGYLVFAAAVLVAWARWALRQHQGVFEWGSSEYRSKLRRLQLRLRDANDRRLASHAQPASPTAQPEPAVAASAPAAAAPHHEGSGQEVPEKVGSAR